MCVYGFESILSKNADAPRIPHIVLDSISICPVIGYDYLPCIFHAYPDVAHTAISPRVHVQDGPMYPCIVARKSVALSGRRFSAHYQRPLMAKIAD